MWAAIPLAVALFIAVPNGFVHGSTHPTLKETDQPIVTESSTRKSGLLGWLQSLLPNGIRFGGPAVGSKNRPEVLAAADCYQSGTRLSCNGFRNLEQYLAAVHASQNLGVSFDKLRAKLQTGRTLQEAIRDLRPGADYRTEARKAEFQAQKLLKNVSS
jgi:hypothetical protein